MDTEQHFAQYHDSYVTDLEEALGDPTLKERAAEAHNTYLEALQTAWRYEEAENVEAAYTRWVRLIREALSSERAQRGAHEAFHAYARAIKRAWLELDPETLDAKPLAVIAEGMMRVSWLAECARVREENETHRTNGLQPNG